MTFQGLRRNVCSFVLLCLALGAKGVPSPDSLGSDLTILLHNDLYAQESTRTADVIVLDGDFSPQEAQAACAALGESLWNPFTAGSGAINILTYLLYEAVISESQFLWVASADHTSVKTINAQGSQGSDDQSLRLPTLCTQSAPLSNISYVDNSERWQTAVNTENATYTGFRDHVSFRFEGIRYAPQPERFTYSSLYDAQGNYSALEFGSECVQTGTNGSEDCLFLNVWTPYLPTAESSTKSGNLKPVLFWIHGGAFTGGTGSDPTFDGGNMASRGDVVIVTINYRLSTLGFLALNDGKTNGNFGFADQIVALDWVQENIRSFGGDPSRITIFGQSAGAASVRAMLASPKAIGKYAAAIPQSNLAGSNYATTYSLYYTIPEEVSVAADPILNETGCANAESQVDCLRCVDADTLVNLPDVARYLVVDGTYLVTDELELNGTGPAAHVPVLMGTMRDDGAAFIGYPTSDNVSAALTADFFPTAQIEASGDFPVPAGPNATLDVFNVTARVATDSEFRCLDYSTAYVAVEHAVFEEVYYYEFNRSYQTPGFDPNAPVCDAPVTPGFPNGNPNEEYFKCHSGELYFEFGNILRMGLPLRDGNDIPFSQFVLDSWTAFARTYNPNPSLAYLAARGYSNTTLELQRAGTWQPVSSDTDLTLRQLQWPSLQLPFKEMTQCDVLGFPLNYYDSHF